jgi:tetratricopeptide (TPR) repeat protein
VAHDAVLQPSGDRASQLAGLQEIRALAAGLGPRHRAEAACRWGAYARLTGDHAGALASGAEAVETARSLGDARWGAAGEVELALCLADQGRFDDACAHADVARELSQRVDDAWLGARALAVRGYVASERGSVFQGLELFQQATDAYARTGDRQREATALMNIAWSKVRLGRLDGVAEDLANVIDLSRRVGNARTVAVAHQNRATLRRMLGDYRGAAEDLEFAAREGQRLSHGRLRSAVATERVYLSLADASRDDPLDDLARDALEASLATQTPSMEGSGIAAALRARARAGADATALLGRADAWLERFPALLETRAELRVAVCIARSGAAEAVAHARTALVAVGEQLAPPDDPEGFRLALALRFLVPATLGTAPG